MDVVHACVKESEGGVERSEGEDERERERERERYNLLAI